MKKIQIFLFALMVSVALGACSDEDDQTPIAEGCAPDKVCFKLNGTDVAVDAVWYDINSQRTRVYYENGSGTSYENIEIDFYGSGPGDYTFVD